MYDRTPPVFHPILPEHPDIVSWIHIGDLHMMRSGERNHSDLTAIVEEINRTFAGKDVSFVYLPGDIADNGSAHAYSAVRECLDKLKLPWCAVVGDHDVQEGSFNNFQQFISPSLHGVFTAGNVRFYRLNAFAEPRPDAFIVHEQQLAWLEQELDQHPAQPSVVLMHCYPSDLKQGAERLTSVLHEHRVLLVDMGHTHYNEISNDGLTLYSATRSTGQIEEGPVGYSVVTLDGDALSWHFVPLGTPALASITSPADSRLLTTHSAKRPTAGQPTTVHVKYWSKDPTQAVTLEGLGSPLAFRRSSETLWSAEVPAVQLTNGSHEATVRAVDAAGHTVVDRIRIAVGVPTPVSQDRSPVDQENAIGLWRDRHLLGTQLGPNKNGKKW